MLYIRNYTQTVGIYLPECVAERERESKRQSMRQIDRPAGTQIDRQIGRQTETDVS